MRGRGDGGEERGNLFFLSLLVDVKEHNVRLREIKLKQVNGKKNERKSGVLSLIARIIILQASTVKEVHGEK